MGIYRLGERYNPARRKRHVALYFTAGILTGATIAGTCSYILSSTFRDAVRHTAKEYHLDVIVGTLPGGQSVKPSSAQQVLSTTTSVDLPKVNTQTKTQLASSMGLYTGPGGVTPHQNFETWLGEQVPYTTDYIDYRGGWQKDFIDSKAWLVDSWGPWVLAASDRRLVLGVPMLEQEDAGQFASGANGTYDTYFQKLTVNLVAAGLSNSIIRLGYEGNCNTIGPWQATDDPSGYKALYRHIVGVMRNIPGASFTFDWTVCNGLQSGHALDSFDSFYPGDDVVDIAGMDLYDVKWQDTSATPELRWNYLWSRQLGIHDFLQFAQAHHKPVSYPEWGLYKAGDSFAGGGDDPYFIQQMYDLFVDTNPTYQAYFDLDWGGGTLENFPNSRALFKSLFGS